MYEEAARRGIRILPEVTENKERPDYLTYLRSTAAAGWSYESDHFAQIAEQVDRCLSGELDRLRIHMPPRHGKTETVTIRLVLYLLEHFPGVQILITGHTQRFASRLGAKIREKYRELHGRAGFAQQHGWAKDDWFTTDGSRVCSRGVGNAPTGEGFDWIIIDDPIKDRKQADSQVYRDSIWDWYTEGVYTRQHPNCRIIGIWTLWHEDDLAGRMDEAEEAGGDTWEKLVLPAIGESGQALWSWRWPLEKLLRIKAVLAKKDGARAWQCLYQQDPTPMEGNMLPVQSLRPITRADVPPGLTWFRCWDVAYTKNDGDWTVGVLLGVNADMSQMVIADVVRGQWEPTDRDRMILATSKADRARCGHIAIGLPRDPAAGAVQCRDWLGMLQGFDVTFIPTHGRNKVAVAAPVASQMGEGIISMVQASWNGDFVKVLRDFPLGKHDDDVDALSDAYALALRRTGILGEDDCPVA